MDWFRMRRPENPAKIKHYFANSRRPESICSGVLCHAAGKHVGDAQAMPSCYQKVSRAAVRTYGLAAAFFSRSRSDSRVTG